MNNVVITASTKGIGRGLAEEFARRGHNVLVSGTDDESVDAALIRVGNRAGMVIGHVYEESDHAKFQSVWDRAVAEFDSVDIWINNSAVATAACPILETSADQVDAILESSFTRTIHGSIVAAAGMIAQGSGKIFNLLGNDRDQIHGIGVYGATQHGLDYFTKGLAGQLQGTGVSIGRVYPGALLTGEIISSIKANRDFFDEHREELNMRVDQVETVSPFLAEKMLKFADSGGEIRWMTNARIAWRRTKSLVVRRTDQFERVGL